MIPVPWSRLADLVPDALALAPGERDAFLDRACTGPDGRLDGALRDEAAALVRAADAADARGALASPLGDWTPEARSDMPDHVGPWRVTGRLGQGGMGVVYAAERAGAGFTQRAALKRTHAGVGADFRARFLRERGLLAGLDHPGIARLLDGGVDDDGAPYLAMERVDGAPITTAAAALPLAERLALFVQACDAVAYAHRNLVVHRDLKPDHIIVADGGRVKLLDFGVAKLLGDADDALHTRTGAGPLTPQYAAPEQLLGQSITTATDVYALGLVLYELLAGRRPYALSGTTAAEAERLVAHAVPPPPSSVAPPDLARTLRGDLDTIVGKALAKEPSRRYASAAALAADLTRYLDGQPVEARPASLAYGARLFARRHRTAVATAATAALLLVGVVVAFTVRLSAERDRARDEAATAAAVTRFLRQTFAEASPAVGPAARPSELRLTDALRRGLASADTAFTDRPAVRAAVLHTLGQTLLDLGLYDDAAAPLREALRLRERLHARAPHADLIETVDALALLAMWRPDLGDADALFARSLALRRAVYGDDSAEAAVGMANLAEELVEDERYDDALRLVARARALIDAGPGRESVPGAEVLFIHAVASFRAGRIAEADTAFATLLTFARRLVAAGAVDADDDRIATLLIGLGQTRLLLGRAADARSLLADALARRAARYDAGQPYLAEAQALHALALLDAGGPARAAETALRAALPALAGGDPYLETAPIARLALARAVRMQGRPVGRDTLHAAVADVRAVLGAHHPWTRYQARHLASL